MLTVICWLILSISCPAEIYSSARVNYICGVNSCIYAGDFTRLKDAFHWGPRWRARILKQNIDSIHIVNGKQQSPKQAAIQPSKTKQTKFNADLPLTSPPSTKSTQPYKPDQKKHHALFLCSWWPFSSSWSPRQAVVGPFSMSFEPSVSYRKCLTRD